MRLLTYVFLTGVLFETLHNVGVIPVSLYTLSPQYILLVIVLSFVIYQNTFIFILIGKCVCEIDSFSGSYLVY